MGTSHFPAVVDMADVMSLVTLLRTGGAATDVVDQVLYVTGCAKNMLGGSPVPNPKVMMASSNPKTDEAIADELENLVKESKALKAASAAPAAAGVVGAGAVPAVGALPPWLMPLLPLLMQLLQGWLSK